MYSHGPILLKGLLAALIDHNFTRHKNIVIIAYNTFKPFLCLTDQKHAEADQSRVLRGDNCMLLAHKP